MKRKRMNQSGGLTILALSLSVVLPALLWSSQVLSAIDAYEFPDEVMEQRYQQLINELRCPQCLNTNLAGSDSMIAKDLRREVHEQILAGRTNEEILDFMQQRYGDFVLYRPRMQLSTLLLWAGPLVVLLLGLFLVYRVIRGAGTRLSSNEEVAPVDETKIDSLLAQELPANREEG